MPFAFGIVGIVFIVAGVRGTSAALMKLLQCDLAGQNNFVYWILSILIIGALGYIQDLRALSRAFLVLILVVLVLHEGGKEGGGGLFEKFQSAIAEITGSSQVAA